MTSRGPEFAGLRLSTEALPPRERVEFFREVAGRLICRLDIEPLSKEPFSADMVLRLLPGLGMLSATSSGMRAVRTPELLADGSGDVILGINTTGVNVVSQLNRQLTTAVGDAVLISSADSGSVAFPERSRLAGLRIPRAALAPLAPGLEDTFVRRIPGDNPALRLLVGYLSVLHDSNALATPELQRLVAAHVHDLVAVAIGASRDAAALAEGRGVRTARLRAIKEDIAKNMGHPELMTVGAVATRHGITPRQVQRLFQTEGTTFSEFVLAQRLVRAHRVLSSRRYAGWTITAIAFETGFGDLSYFNRAFRRLYGASPSEVREATRARTKGSA